MAQAQMAYSGYTSKVPFRCHFNVALFTLPRKLSGLGVKFGLKAISSMNITVEDVNQISAEAVMELEKHADMIECQCPNKLVGILQHVREFTDYTDECIEKYPEDSDTHKWLKSSAINIDQLLSTTIIQLARLEGFIDENNQFVDRGEGHE